MNVGHPSVIRYHAGVMKLVDMPDLGSGASRRGGSSPSTRTQHKINGMELSN